MILKYNSFVGQWVDVKKKEKDKNGENVIWKGNLESVSDNGCTLWNGQSSAGGFSKSKTYKRGFPETQCLCSQGNYAQTPR
nr:hypothetical protein HAGR004_15770 [Bdellovibrio sp. HAGR004]